MLSPLPAAKWNYATALHLSNRAGFGATGGEIEKLIAMGPDRAVDHYVDFEKVPEDQGAPAWAHPDPERMEKLREMRRAGGEKKKELIKEYQREQRRHLIELRAWWLNKMASGSRPLQEKLVLFWHGHFATSVQKVKDAYLMWLQNDTFRRNAHGQWLSILEKVSKDPAMLIWLDQFQSKKEHPNENYAREVMELFALGEGHYTEKDVTEAARALTGWTCNRVTQKFIDDKRQHDTGVKSFLGQTGNLDGLDVLRQIVAQPQSGRFITRKLWNFFSSDNPTPRLAEALAAHFEKNGQHFKPFLQTLFRSEEFYAEEVRASQVKSPAQWLVGSVRMLDRELPPPLVCSALLGSLGQDLFAPPNVKGWDGGVAWITTNNLLNRYNQSALLVEGEKVVEMAAKGKNGGAGLRMLERELSRSARGVKIERLFSAEERRSRESFLGALEKRFLACPLKKEQKVTLREYLEGEGELTEQAMLHSIRLIMCTPQYQLT